MAEFLHTVGAQVSTASKTWQGGGPNVKRRLQRSGLSHANLEALGATLLDRGNTRRVTRTNTSRLSRAPSAGDVTSPAGLRRLQSTLQDMAPPPPPPEGRTRTRRAAIQGPVSPSQLTGHNDIKRHSHILAGVVRNLCVAANVFPAAKGEGSETGGIFLRTALRDPREVLRQEIVSALAPFLKARQKESRRKSIDILRAISKEILNEETRVKSVMAEVDCATLLRKLVEQPEPTEETQDERTERLKDYLEHYHAKDVDKACERTGSVWRSRQSFGEQGFVRSPRGSRGFGREEDRESRLDSHLSSPLQAPSTPLSARTPRAPPPMFQITHCSEGSDLPNGPPPPSPSRFRNSKRLSKNLSRSGSRAGSRPGSRPISRYQSKDGRYSSTGGGNDEEEEQEVNYVCWRRAPFSDEFQRLTVEDLATQTRLDRASIPTRASPTYAKLWPPPSPRPTVSRFSTTNTAIESPKPSSKLRLPSLQEIVGPNMPSDWGDSCMSPGQPLSLPLLPPEGGGRSGGLPAAQSAYLTECQARGMAPLVSPFVTGHSNSLSLQGRGLEDRHILPISVMGSHLLTVEELDLAHNPKLTHHSLTPLFSNFVAGARLGTLRLSGCTHLGHHVIDEIVSLVGSSLALLSTLDLAQVRLSASAHLNLAKAIGSHPSLETVVLSDTGLGHAVGGPEQTRAVLTELLRGPCLETLDLGWSRLTESTFGHLGQCLSTSNLSTLLVPCCATSSSFLRGSSVEFFLEFLGEASSLTRLDISLNTIDWKSALVLEDAVETHPDFRELVASNNPLGAQGLRSLLRLLARDENGLVRLEVDDASQGLGEQSGALDDDCFDPVLTAGRYSLDLQRPFCRACLRLLLKKAEVFIGVKNSFSELQYDRGYWAPPKKDETGRWIVPSEGIVTFNYIPAPGPFGPPTEDMGASVWDFESFLEDHMAFLRRPVHDSKVVALLSRIDALRGRQDDQHTHLAALARDFIFKFGELRALARDRELAMMVVNWLLGCVAGGQSQRYLTMLLATSHRSFVRHYDRCKHLLGFNAQCPTGRYRLDLTVAADHAVAEKLFLLDRWEVAIDLFLKRADCSQWGLRTHLRNVRYQHKLVPPQVRLTEWRPAPTDILELDYVTGKRPSNSAVVVDGASALDDETFFSFLEALKSSKVEVSATLLVLRSMAHWIPLRCSQLRELIGIHDDVAWRSDLYVLFYFLLVDIQNEKMFRARFGKQEELRNIRERLGWVASFPFIQPERASFEFNLEYHDCRLAVTFLIQLISREQANVRPASLTDEAGNVDPLSLGIPRSWDSLEKIPTAGMFCVTYSVGVEDRALGLRRTLLDKYGWWKTSLVDVDVQWWSGINEAPPVVLTFAEWCNREFRDLQAAHQYIAQSDRLAASAFELRLGDRKQDIFGNTTNNSESLQIVFRYLDGGGKGQISRAQWKVLEQLSLDSKLALRELAMFLSEKCKTLESAGVDIAQRPTLGRRSAAPGGRRLSNAPGRSKGSKDSTGGPSNSNSNSTNNNSNSNNNNNSNNSNNSSSAAAKSSGGNMTARRSSNAAAAAAAAAVAAKAAGGTEAAVSAAAAAAAAAVVAAEAGAGEGAGPIAATAAAAAAAGAASETTAATAATTAAAAATTPPEPKTEKHQQPATAPVFAAVGLDAAWNLMVEQSFGGGEVDEGTWFAFVQDKCHYFGPVGALFQVLDRNRNGLLGLGEFLTLNACATMPWPLPTSPPSSAKHPGSRPASSVAARPGTSATPAKNGP